MRRNRIDLKHGWTGSVAHTILLIDESELIRRYLLVALGGQLGRLLAAQR